MTTFLSVHITAAPGPGPQPQEALIQSEEQRLQLARALIDFQVGSGLGAGWC